MRTYALVYRQFLVRCNSVWKQGDSCSYYIPAEHIHAALATVIAFTAIREVLTKPNPKLLIQRHLQWVRCCVKDDFGRDIIKPVKLVCEVVVTASPRATHLSCVWSREKYASFVWMRNECHQCLVTIIGTYTSPVGDGTSWVAPQNTI